MTEPLAALLDCYYHDTLLEIAASNGLPTLGADGRRVRKDVLLRTLCERVYTPQAARDALTHLSVLQRTVLDRILLHGGQVDTNGLRDELEREGIVQGESIANGTEYRPRRQAGDSRAGSFEDVLAELTLHGLVLSAGHPQTWNPSARLDLNPGLRLLVPEPVREGLPQPALPSVEWGSTTLPAAPAETSVTLAQRDLFIYWSYVRAQPIAVTQLGLVQKRTLRALNEQLLFPDSALPTAANEQQAPRLHFLRLLLQGLGLLHRDSKWITAEPNGQAPLFWSKTVEQRTQTCLRVWMHLADWSELSSLGMSSFDLDLQHGRGTLLEQLRLLEPGVWLSADRFLSRLSMTISNLLFSTRDAHPAALYYSGYLGQQSTSQRLAEMEGTFVGGALSGPLHWLGLVDIATDGSRLLAFRLNDSGALALGTARSVSAAAESADEARLVVQPNFQIFALGPVSEAILAKLELFADRVKADRSAFEYTLSHAAIYRGQKAGLSTNQIIGFLEQESGAALPQNVLRTLQEWGEQHERIVFHRSVALCEAPSAEMMAELWNEPAIQPYLQQHLTPTVALLKKGRVQALRETLLQRDLLPALSTRADRCAGRLQAKPDGELTPVHEGPDLLLDSCLRGVADLVPTLPDPAKNAGQSAGTQGGAGESDGHFCITEGAVRRAAETGSGVKGYLERLGTLHHGPLPAVLERRIKSWGRYYGQALLQEAVLLEVKDAATADELMADAELAPLLSRFAADPRGRLLLVHAEELEHLQRLLEERGVEVVPQP